MKSRVLLDNATLTSVQRALGYVKVQNESVFDLEIANLSNFCDAILFSDDIYIPYDIYISKFINERKDLFEQIGVMNLNIEKDEEDINEIASKLFSRWYLDYNDDNTGLFNRIMNLMDIYMKFVWNHRSSEYWLVMRAFQSQEGNISGGRLPIFEALLTEPNQNIWEGYKKAGSHDIVDSMGRILKEEQLREGYRTMPGPKKMIAAMSWNIYRAIYYRIVATLNDCTYYPHSLRGIGAILDSITVKDKSINEGSLSLYGFTDSCKMISDSFNEILEKQKSELFSVGAITGSMTFSIPPILGYILSKTNYKEEFFEVLLKMRNDSKVVNLRGELREFEESVRQGDFTRIRKWKISLEKTSNLVQKEIGLEESKFVITPLSYITGGMISEKGIGISIPKSFNKIITSPQNWRIWYREVALNLQNVARLGQQYDKLKSWTNFIDTEAYNWYSKNDYPMKYTHTLEKGIKN